jgi:hypothetical protein
MDEMPHLALSMGDLDMALTNFVFQAMIAAD